ncbi:MAG: AraC family transcriptional regulator [Lachnospiraceae bacterium]|nr:AraC family transcriptional regulator [Lachnospiraceae bacterium]
MQVEMSVKNDRSERVAYNRAGFPAYVRRGILSTYPSFRVISHWHDDVEFIHVQSGHMDYNINGTIVHLKEGEGIFVNTRQFHYGFSKDFEECIFICILIHPMLLCSSPYVEKRYVLPVMENACMPYLVLHPDQEHEKEILELLDQMYNCFDEELFAIRMQSLFFNIWENLFLLSDHMEQQTVPRNQHLSALKDMIRFIYNNYAEKISLTQISHAGKVGKTTCCAIFQKYTNVTPIFYLNSYRMEKGVELLITTDKTVSEICFETGFSSASYFTETFRRIYHCTPREYRQKHNSYQQF